ncbi:MAG TPA: hypothetical protein DCY07_03835, partial [Rhodospirillaceae bacterium]|nr:hypothetical protein [Rhodospirillaceae bacterium]
MVQRGDKLLYTATWNIPIHLLILATATREKPEHYETIARERGMPLHVIMMDRVVSAFHSAEEDTGT